MRSGPHGPHGPHSSHDPHGSHSSHDSSGPHTAGGPGCSAVVTRRRLVRAGLGAAIGMLALPDALTAAVAAAAGGDRSGALRAAAPDATPDATPNATPNATRHRATALAAARWVRAARVATPRGVAWPADPTLPASVGTDLYNGMPGVVLFCLELYHATGDRLWLEDATRGANELIGRLETVAASRDCGLYTGLAGLGFVLEETHRAAGAGVYRDAARHALRMVHTQARRVADGVAWSGDSDTTDIISGSAGIGLFLLWADRWIGDPASRRLAAAAGRDLVARAQPTDGGLKWAISPAVPHLYPNFSHGTAGVSYFLATLYRATGERAFLDAALAGARYLEAVADRDNGGIKVFHHEPGGEGLFYLSWCHGPAGLSRLFYRLGEVTHEERWPALVRQAAIATMNSGLPEQRAPGFWNNISQCCGNAGVGEYFLSLDRLMPDPSYARMAQRIAADTLRRATEEEHGLAWIQAENRVQPEYVVAQTGFMQGASGVGTLFLHLDAAARGRWSPAIAWPDTPFV